MKTSKIEIFNIALKQFAEEGYDKVSIRDITGVIGINVASLYNYFSSKEQILDACYSFYIKHRFTNRPTKEHYEYIIKHGKPEEIVDIPTFVFPDDIAENMFHCMFVIFSRIYIDPRAREIHDMEVAAIRELMTEMLNYGVEIGRIEPFDVDVVATIFLSVIYYTVREITLNQQQRPHWNKVKVQICRELIKVIPFKY